MLENVDGCEEIKITKNFYWRQKVSVKRKDDESDGSILREVYDKVVLYHKISSTLINDNQPF